MKPCALSRLPLLTALGAVVALGACTGPNPAASGDAAMPAGPPAPPDLATPADPGTATDSSVVAYLRGARLHLESAVHLADGTVLVAGGARSLADLPPGPRIQLEGTEDIKGQPGGTSVGFILQLTADLEKVLLVTHLPPGVAYDIRHVRLASYGNAPRSPVWISGTTYSSRDDGSGVFFAKLSNDYLAGPPGGLDWVRSVWAGGTLQRDQPWDVDRSGRVFYAMGDHDGKDFAAIQAFDNGGRDAVMAAWRYHVGTRLADGAPFAGYFSQPPIARKDLSITRSALVLKMDTGCDLRSWTQADYKRPSLDGIGDPRQGTWPYDLLFAGPCDPAAPSASGPGYTGLGLSPYATAQVGAITTDQRDGLVYLGLMLRSSTGSTVPAVVAMNRNGELRFWSRLRSDSLASSPAQYIDALAIDYSDTVAQGGTLVVGARSEGRGLRNLWQGELLPARPAARSFQRQFTGDSAVPTIGWLGKLSLTDGTLLAATYVGEFDPDLVGTGAPLASPNLDGWPDLNQGWPEVVGTQLNPGLRVDKDGRVYVLGVTEGRTITTRDGYQRMPKPSEGKSVRNEFFRLYDADLSGIRYSTLLTGAWDLTTGAGGDNTRLRAVVPLWDGALVIGNHAAQANGSPKGNPIPTRAVPAWMTATPDGESGFLARLYAP